MHHQNGHFQVITGARLLDGTGAPAIERGAVLLEDSVVRWVGPEADLRLPEGAEAQTLHYPDAHGPPRPRRRPHPHEPPRRRHPRRGDRRRAGGHPPPALRYERAQSPRVRRHHRTPRTAPRRRPPSPSRAASRAASSPDPAWSSAGGPSPSAAATAGSSAAWRTASSACDRPCASSARRALTTSKSWPPAAEPRPPTPTCLHSPSQSCRPSPTRPTATAKPSAMHATATQGIINALDAGAGHARPLQLLPARRHLPLRTRGGGAHRSTGRVGEPHAPRRPAPASGWARRSSAPAR